MDSDWLRTDKSYQDHPEEAIRVWMARENKPFCLITYDYCKAAFRAKFQESHFGPWDDYVSRRRCEKFFDWCWHLELAEFEGLDAWGALKNKPILIE